MIELQRARLLATGKGSRAAVKGGKGSKAGAQQQANQTPQQRAAAAVRSEDEQLGNFIQRLSHRDDSREGSIRVPTVPTALTRRILNKQGAGFLDPTIAAAVSAAGDRFLATILHQAVACRDQRLKGAEVQREASQNRKRHLEQVEADKDDRERRREAKAKKREQVNMEIIMTAEAVTKKRGSVGGDKDSKPSPKSKKKKKDDGSSTGSALNGARLKKIDRSVLNDNDDEQSFDSMDEEEEYYKRYYGDDETGVRDDDEEEDEALLLRDLVHPLEAWQFTLSGKKGLLPNTEQERGDGRNNADAEAEDGEKMPAEAEDGDEEPESDEDGDGDDPATVAGGGGGTSNSNTTNRKKAASPLPATGKNDKIKKSPSPVPAAGGQSAAQPPRNSSSPVPS